MPESSEPGRQDGPAMKSVNILMTTRMRDGVDAMDADSRSDAVRRIAAIVLTAHEAGEPVMEEVQRHVAESAPARRREMEETGIEWTKAIVWLPDGMLRTIRAVCQDPGADETLTPSEFLRGAVAFATA